ncbi:uncharacterized protein LOC111080777 [Drosophila obscura]|uniref:uncharacterized protein LOC111080777 n=1 Tax=Drosophila obscura TaxID=7282 RepID=UPI001BB2A07B|nr:uncharacterized protein LOC111080777 [Drosophila obscura]
MEAVNIISANTEQAKISTASRGMWAQLASEGFRKMSTASLIVFCVCALLLGHTLGQDPPVNYSLQWAKDTGIHIRMVIEEKLPNTARAQAEGSEIADAFDMGLGHCNTELVSSRNIAQHKVCVNALAAGAYAALDRVAGQQWAIYGASSGASRIGLFW